MHVIIKFKVNVWLVPDFKSDFVGQRFIICSPIYNASHSSEHVVSNISNTRDSFSSGYPNTEKRVDHTTRSGVFLMKFKVFG